MSSSSKAATRRALARIAALFTTPRQRRKFSEMISSGPDLLSVGSGGHRRTPIEVSRDLWGDDEVLDLWLEPPDVTEIFQANLARLIEEDKRSLAQLGREAFGSEQGRKKIQRALDVGWPRPDVAEGLARVFGIAVDELFAWHGPAPALAEGFFVDDQTNDVDGERFVGSHRDGWCGEPREMIADAEADCRAEAARREEQRAAG